MNTNQSFQQLDLAQLDHVAGGGKIWRKIKKAVKKWAGEVAGGYAADVNERIEAAKNGGGSTVTQGDQHEITTEEVGE